MITRRRFVSASLACVPAALAASLSRAASWAGWREPVLAPDARRALGFPVASARWHGESSVAAALRARQIRSWPGEPEPPPGPAPAQDPRWGVYAEQLRRFRDLRRHFVFEYYPWYDADPWRHWDENARTPPWDLAAFSVPRLGPYDSDDSRVIEQHARWIADAGVGAVNLSWWGPDSAEDQRVPLIMDVMRAHDIHVTFHLEPYADDRPGRYAADVLYLLREYGEKRRWDNFLLLEDAEGRACPVLKSFRTFVPPAVTDCHGVVRPVPDYVTDSSWRRQTESVRTAVRAEFDRLILLADSLDTGRTLAAGFDGTAIYDPFVRPQSWLGIAQAFSADNLLFSFPVNPGFDHYPVRGLVDDCFVPWPFEPPVATVDWSDAAARETVLDAIHRRIVDSMRLTIQLQLDPQFSNARRGFFVVFINSFNEWHEGTAFEPAKDLAGLTSEEQSVGYHNPPDGEWRLELLLDILHELEHPRPAWPVR